jgi:hypothetical protein
MYQLDSPGIKYSLDSPDIKYSSDPEAKLQSLNVEGARHFNEHGDYLRSRALML